MPKFEAPVGRGGRNLVHDVAVTQAAFAVIKGADLRPLWPGPIDDNYQRHGQALEGVITAFQQAQRRPETGRIDASGAMPMVLERVLPPTHKNLAGLKGTAVVFRVPDGFRPWDALARETVASAPAPKVERQALAALQKRIGEDLGLCLGIEDAVITRDGRFEVRLICAETEWLDPATKRFRIDGRMPHAALWLFAGKATGNAVWRTAARAGDHATFDLTSTRQIDALKGPAKLDQAALNLFRITTPPMDPVADACIAACARLLAESELNTTAAKQDFNALIETLETIAPDAAKKIILASGHEDLSLIGNEPFGGPSRALAPGEINLALNVFGGAINLDAVEVRHYKFFSEQDVDRPMAPDGNIYAPLGGNRTSQDYSIDSLRMRATFIHEMTHVWQHQKSTFGVLQLLVQRISESSYNYVLHRKSTFNDYGIEQQAAIVADYYLVKAGGRTIHVLGRVPRIAEYEKILPFIGIPIGETGP